MVWGVGWCCGARRGKRGRWLAVNLQQLRYLIAVADNGSLGAASRVLYVSQSSLSIAIKELEEEMGVQIFNRSNRGLTLTTTGSDLVGHARQVVAQADLMMSCYKDDPTREEQPRLVISAQHYPFCVEILVDYLKEKNLPAYTVSLHETRTAEIIREVREFRSDLGILYYDDTNEQFVKQTLREAQLEFTPLFESRVHACLGAHHPLASRASLCKSDLRDYPRYSFAQGSENFFFHEEPLGRLANDRNITVSDRDSLAYLLTHHDGFTLSTGILSKSMGAGVVAVPLEGNASMHVGYVVSKRRPLGSLAKEFLVFLDNAVEERFDVQWGA